MCRCYEGEERPAAILEKTESRIFQIASREIKGGFQPTRELADAAYKEIEEAAKNKRTGLRHRYRLHRTQPDDRGIPQPEPGGRRRRPGLGKTSFCLNIASRAAIRAGKQVGIFSLDMSKPEIMKRMISSLSEVDAHRIQSGYLSRDDWAKIGQATARLSAAPIYIDDSANLTHASGTGEGPEAGLEHGIDLLVVDYLQLVSGSGRRYENRTQEVTEISRGLKNLAKELDIPVIAVSQLNREVEKRSGTASRSSATSGIRIHRAGL